MKKIVIEIADDDYNRINSYPEGKTFYPITARLYKAVKDGTPQPKIVRCSQCKYAEVADLEDSQDGYTCQFHRGSIWFSGSYCSWAERRQDG